MSSCNKTILEEKEMIIWIIFTIIYAHIIEYVTHRWLMHFPLFGRCWPYTEHAVEHHLKKRNDVNIYISPLVPWMFLTPLLFGVYYLGYIWVFVLFLFGLMYSITWSFLHMVHHDLDKQKSILRVLPGYKYWRAHHLNHHKKTTKNFGTVFPWTDIFFGTKYLFILIILSNTATAQMMSLPVETRMMFKNHDGSCVQCSIGMCGAWNNTPSATYLLWDTEYGQKVRGGSGPSRVAKYCRERNIPIYNVTGKTTFAWMEWAARTGRFAAIGAGRNHFQTEYGRDKDFWYVCNNNSPSKIDKYTNNEFKKLHLASGPWIVILDVPAPAPPPEYIKWW